MVLNDYRNLYPDGSEENMLFNDWLRTDLECGADTISTFLSQWQMPAVDNNRIDSLGICGGAGYTLAAAQTDKRIRAVAPLFLYGMFC